LMLLTVRSIYKLITMSRRGPRQQVVD